MEGWKQLLIVNGAREEGVILKAETRSALVCLKERHDDDVPGAQLSGVNKMTGPR